MNATNTIQFFPFTITQWFKKAMTILSFLLLSLSVFSQNIDISAKIDTASIPIGDQANLTLEVAQPKGEIVLFPIFNENIIDKVEIVERSVPDTNDLGQDRILVSQKYTITSFQDSLYYIPAMPFVNGSDTNFSNPLSLNVVQPFEIDTANQAISDIKNIYKPKIYWWGIFRIVLLVLLVLGLGVAGFFLYRKFAHKKVGEAIFEKPAPMRPAHEVALEELDKIKVEKLWQHHGRQKEYHTQLTSVLRLYIEQTYGIGSMEMTSIEILEGLRNELKQNKEVYMALKQILSLADLVKFAKWTPMPDENEQSLSNAYLFVRETMPQEIEETAATVADKQKQE